MRQGRVDHDRDAPLGNRPELGDGQRDLVGGKGNRFGMKVTPGHNGAGRGQDERVVGDGIGFDFKGLRNLAQKVHTRPGDLRLASYAIGILDPAVAIAMAFADLGTLHEVP